MLIIGPSKIFPGRRYSMVISNFLDRTAHLSIALQNDDVSPPIILKNKDIRQNANILVDFDVPENLAAGNYKISIDGIKGFSFYAEATANVPDATISGLIQLDKPVYKPGDTVNFRVIVLDSELKPPTKLSSVTINIYNHNDDLVGEWKKAQLKTGVYEGSFLIAPAPLIGTYNFVVESNKLELARKNFEVMEYILSEFNIDVTPSRVPLEEHQRMDLTISAKNMLGQFVKGNIELTLYEDELLSLGKATREVDGVTHVNIIFSRELYIDDPSQDILVNFTFTELYTNRTMTKSIPITIFKSMYRARLVKESPEFHHGKPFKATVKLEYHDGSPASNVKCRVEAAGTKEGNFERVSDVKGEISLQLTASESYDELILTVWAGEQEILEENIQKATFDNEALLEVTIKNK